jgi:hypothetical protein
MAKLPNSVLYLQNLGVDPAARSKFKLDPHGAMANAGLSDAEMAAVLSKDPARINMMVTKALGQAPALGDFTIVIVA